MRKVGFEVTRTDAEMRKSGSNQDARAQGRLQRAVNRLAILQPFTGHFPLLREK